MKRIGSSAMLATMVMLGACGSGADDGNAATASNSAQAAAPTPPPALPANTTDAPENFSVGRAGGIRRTGTDTNYTLNLPTDVLFDFDKSELRPEATPMLREVLADLEGKSVFALQVFGHTDAKGEEQYNMRLSLRRAKSVCDYLKREGKQYTLCLGRGEQEPVEPNAKPDGSDNPYGRQLNRRVEIKVAIKPDVGAMMGKAQAQSREALDTLKPP